jgi:hypothetical protein
MFLPSEIALRAQEFSYFDPLGREHKLISDVEIINRAVNRPAVLDTPRLQWPRELVLGCALALFFALLRLFRSRGNIAADKTWALGQGAMGLFFGFSGTILFFMMFFTDHDYTYKNINILFANPLLLSALFFGIRYCRAPSQNRKKLEAAIKTIWSGCLGLALISILVNELPFFRQQNQVDLALILPPVAALTWLPDLCIHIREKYLIRRA